MQGDEAAQIAEQVGSEIRRARKARGWSQARLAEELGISVEHMGLLERGDRLPSVEVLVRISKTLGVSAAVLLGEPPDEPWIAEVLALLRTLPESGRAMMLGMIRGAAVETTKAPTKAQRAGARRKRAGR